MFQLTVLNAGRKYLNSDNLAGKVRDELNDIECRTLKHNDWMSNAVNGSYCILGRILIGIVWIPGFCYIRFRRYEWSSGESSSDLWLCGGDS